MGVLSFLKRKPGGAKASPAAVDTSLDTVQQARTRARQRLIGALVLLSIGVVGFPLLFESQPRPIPVDIPIDIPAKETVGPLAMPGPRASGVVPQRVEPPPVPDVITETRADAGRDVTPAEPVAAAAVPKIESKFADRAQRAPPTADAARAQALLEGKGAPTTGATTAIAPAALTAASAAPWEARFIVQVGAFADPQAARETRLKVEKLGLKTYTQVADTPAGKRIRVRVGPFSGRTEADKAMARVRAAGVAAAVLTL